MISNFDSAPKDGTVILTDQGLTRYMEQWGYPTDWYLCNIDGDIIRCADDGYRVSATSFKKWCPLTDIPLFEDVL